MKTNLKEIEIDQNPEVLEIKKDVVKLNKTAQALLVQSDEDVIKATELLSKVKDRANRLEKARTFLVKPLNDHIKTINASFKALSEPLAKIEAYVKQQVVKYRQVVEAKRVEEEKKLQEKFEKKQEKLKEQGKETFDLKPTIEATPIKIASKSGAITAKKVWQFEIIDETKIPREYLIVDERKIREAIRNGVREINGVRIYETESIAVNL